LAAAVFFVWALSFFAFPALKEQDANISNNGNNTICFVFILLLN
jgi:hypothetical protein